MKTKLILILLALCSANVFAQYNQAVPYPTFYPTGSSSSSVPGTNNKTQATLNNPAYFADITNNVVADKSTFPPPAFPGQIIQLYSAAIGGDTAGQIFVGNSGTNWCRDFQFGRITIFATNGVNGEALYVKSTNGTDNVVTIQNQASNHYSAARFLDMVGNEVSALGYGNSNATYYANVNYWEDLGNNKGAYFASSGHLNGGLERGSQDLVWYNGSSGTNDTSATVVGRLSKAGVFTNASFMKVGTDFYVGGSQWNSTVAGQTNKLAGGIIDPNSIISMTNALFNFGSGGGVGAGIEFETIGGVVGHTYRRFGEYTTIQGVPWMRIEHDQLNVNNICLIPPSGVVIVNSTNTGDIATPFQVSGIQANQGSWTKLTNQFTIAGTGYTNTQSYNQVAYPTAAAVAITYSDGTNTISTTTASTGASFVLHPSWKITAAAGLGGPVVPQ